jgi:leucyl-tRNA synthetase
MSKARGGVVNPEPIVRGHAAGAHRLHEVFVGPIEAAKPWRCSRSG